MAKLKKRTPVKVPSDMERPIQQIYDDINDIINSVNRFHLEGEETEGKIGDIRITQTQDDNTNRYYIEFRTRDGWARSEGTIINE